LIERWRVKPNHGANLREVDPASTSGSPGGKAETEAIFGELHDELRDLHDRLWAEGKRALLVVLQAMDAGGKDGTIRHIFKGLQPQAATVTTFKAPTPEDKAHDFLWRVHKATPEAGHVGVFNRSHYEDVVVVRVRRLASEEVWRPRFGLIENFEEMLSEEGTTIVKLYLHISKEEQRRRFEERLRRPDKRWKFNPDDLEVRALWGDFQKAYEEALERTSTESAPWYVIPADHKWYRNWAVSHVLIKTLKKLNPKYPDPSF
jgi:PPK2 family polyphosphate:nucleotide phosphotransferase